jgi:ankyrin repeat protein
MCSLNSSNEEGSGVINLITLFLMSVVEYLIKNGADVHAQDDYAFKYASRYGHKDVVKYLNNHIKNEKIEALQKQLLDIQNKLNALIKTQ